MKCMKEASTKKLPHDGVGLFQGLRSMGRVKHQPVNNINLLLVLLEKAKHHNVFVIQMKHNVNVRTYSTNVHEYWSSKPALNGGCKRLFMNIYSLCHCHLVWTLPL